MATKICHMTSVHQPEDVRIFHKECTSLAKAGYEVYLVERGDTYEKNGVHIVGIGEVTGGRINRMLNVAKKVYEKAVAIDADIYHLHDPELLPYGLKLKKLGKKVIFDSHERYVEQIKEKKYLRFGTRKVTAWLYKKYENYVLSKIDAVIFPCTQNGRHPFEGKCRRYITVDNFPILSELYDKYNSEQKKEERSLCYIGSLTHNRGITHLVKAVGEANAKLYLAGKFSPAKYENQLASMKGWKNATYLGFLNRAGVLELLNKTQIGIAALLNVGQYGRYDNLATKAHEYLSLAIPVILTKNPYNEYVINKYGFGICVDPTDTKEYVRAIEYLFTHPEEAKKMGENGRRAVREEFNWDTQAKKLIELYEVLAKS